MRRHDVALTCLALILALFATSCAAIGRNRGSAATTPVDSATVALWRMDEPGGFNVADAGPNHLDARAGADVGTDFGRYRGTRVFKRSIESFLYVPHAPAMDVGTITVDAWIQPQTIPSAEIAPLVGRWTELANEQSWLFGIVGLNLGGLTGPPSPGTLAGIIRLGAPGFLVFAFQPADASRPVSFFSNAEIALDRWTHVAVTFDGREVVFYVDGRLDSQYAYAGGIRASQAPLLFGNYFDPRWITDLGDRPQVGAGVDRNPWYAYEGMIDELRISNVARTEFGTQR